MKIFSKKGNNSTVTIDGVCFNGDVSIMSNGKVIVNGVEQEQSVVGDVHVTIEGDVDELSNTSGTVHVIGNCNSVKTMSGTVYCEDIEGNVNTMSGDVSCSDIAGKCSTMSGNINTYKLK